MERTKITRLKYHCITNPYLILHPQICYNIFGGIFFMYVCNMFELNQENVSEQSLQAALEQLQKGEIIVIHTKQYYTIVCDATHTEAVNRLVACAEQCNMHITLIMASEREILHHTASIDLAIFDALAELEDKIDFPIGVWCNGALNLAVGVENTLGQFLLHKTTNELMKQLIKRLRNPISCLQANEFSNLTSLKALFPTLTAAPFEQTPFFAALAYQTTFQGTLEPVRK